jgi:Outer membrane lipoprotein carrier protein LolA-like
VTASSIRVVAFLGLAILSGKAMGLSVPEIERLLQASARGSVSFVETRESPWLTFPVQSAGTMRSGPNLLEKRIETPRPETWRMLSDRVEWLGPDGTTTKQILFTQSPGLAVLADTLRRVVAGDLTNLDRTFRMETRGDHDNWILRMNPRGGDAARYLDYVEVEGGRGEIRVITVVERQGERTTTRLQPQ